MNKKMVVAGMAVVLPVALIAMGQVAGAPSLKEGLWSVHTTTVANPGGKSSEGTISLCRSHAYDDYVRSLEAKHSECTIKRTPEGDKTVSEATCKIGETTLVTKSVVTMTGDTASHSESHTTYTPPLRGATDSTMVQDQKYVGPCPADMQPGDRKAADGTVMHGWKH